MEPNKISRQSRSDEANPQKNQKGSSNTRSHTGNAVNGQASAAHTATKKSKQKGDENSVDRDKQKYTSATHDQNGMNGTNGDVRSHQTPGYQGGTEGQNGRRVDKPLSLEMTPNDAENSAALSGSGGIYNVVSSQSPEASAPPERRQQNQVQSSQSTVGGYMSAAANGKHQNHLSNKSDTNINGAAGQQNGSSNAVHKNGTNNGATHPNNRSHVLPGENKKKRKSSEKRRASNNKRGDRENDDNRLYRNQGGGMMIPPIEGSAQSANGGSGHIGSAGGHPRSHSRGTAVSQHSAGQSGHLNSQPPNTNQVSHQQFYDPSGNYNPFAVNNNNNQNQQQFPMNSSFPFGNNGTGPFMGNNQQVPQVHFIAKKQQFIAQISPEQLVNGDKRPYTAQSLHNLSANAKRAGSVYANAHGSGKSSSNATYNIANAAFTNYPAAYLGGIGQGSKTHTSGFSFHPGPGHAANKYSGSVYGDGGDVKPKVAGRDILHALGSSNGFSSGYNSDPYSSMMISALPTTFSHSTRPTKSKASNNRLNTKEKEQLYDETIKMKVLNNQMKEDAVKLKTKVKILENELSRKEKTIEDLFSQNQLISQSHSSKQQVSGNSNLGLLPLAQTAHKYQQETFLVMSLKKQIRELKYEVAKRDEELEILRKNMKNTRTKELEQEIEVYHEECLRLRNVMEDLIKQGAAHPIHHHTFIERVNQMQAEIAHKDMMIKQLTDNLNGQQKLTKDMNGQHTSSSNTAVQFGGTQGSSTLAGVRSQESQGFEAHQSDIMPLNSSVQASTHTVGRDKSVEKKHLLASNPAGTTYQKDIQKELQRARKQLRDKEKEIVKMRQEVTQIRRESQEKFKSDNQLNKDVESHVKTLREKLKDAKNELKRKDDKALEGETKVKRLEDQLRGLVENNKDKEESCKQLKAELRKSKNQQVQKQPTAPKAAGEQKGEEKKVMAESKPIEKELVKKESAELIDKKPDVRVPQGEMALITLIGQREKLSRDDLTAMILAGEESLRMLIRKPSDGLIDFIKANLDDEDCLLAAIPRFEMPKSEFESQVLREMRVVLKDNSDRIENKTLEELMKWEEFEEFYNCLSSFDYPHKDKLLEFIKYFFLDHIESETQLFMNYAAFKEHLLRPRPPGAVAGTSADKSRNEGGSLRSRRRGSGESAGSYNASGSAEDALRRRLVTNGGPEEDKSPEEEERMLDIAEQCFMRIADLLHMQQKTVRQIFLRYSQPEQFKDGQVLELLSPRGFLEGVKDSGFDDVTEMEAACLMKVLAKPELDNSVILNEFVLIMENFGIPAIGLEEDEYENDFIPDSDSNADNDGVTALQEEEAKGDNKLELNQDEKAVSKPNTARSSKEEDKTDEPLTKAQLLDKHRKFQENPKSNKKHTIEIKFDDLDEKGTKILKRLARFLLERYMHPREFFGPTIKKEVFGKKKCKVEVIKLHDFYLRLKLASIRKKLKDIPTLSGFLGIDSEKHQGFVQVKRMIKALEIIAEKEQELMIKEQEEKEKLEKETADKEAKEREEQGLPPLTKEEIEKEKYDKEEQLEKEKLAKEPKKEVDPNAPPNPLKPPKGGQGNLDEMLKLQGGKSTSPKGSEKDGKYKFASHLGANTQLNTIEEDLHETQTSHYSYQVREGEISDREGSKHQLSTSNQLRTSNVLQEIEDSSRRSINKGQLNMGQSVNSGDYSGGSNSSKKAKAKDIDSNDVTIQDFKRVERNKSDLQNLSDRVMNQQDSLRNKSIKEEMHEDDPSFLDQPRGSRTQKHQSGIKTQSLPPGAMAVSQGHHSQDDNDPYESQFDATGDPTDFRQIKDELDAVVDKKFQKTFDTASKIIGNDDENYDDDEYEEKDELKQDTIKTDKIEQIVEEEMKDQISGRGRNNNDLIEARPSVDDLDIHADTEQQPEKLEEYEEPDEYSFHDDESVNSNNRINEKDNQKAPVPQHGQQNQESDIDEDYEF